MALDEAGPSNASLSVMTRAITAFFLALGDLPRPHVLRLLAQSLALTLLVMGVAGGVLFYSARWALAQWPGLQPIESNAAGALVALALVALAWLAFRGVAIAVIGLFADAIVAEVETRHYPDMAARAVDVGWQQNIRLGLASIARLIAGNLLALPFYILLLVTGIGTPLFALAVNALLLGRDLEAMVLARHPAAPRLGRASRWALGTLSAAAFLVPVANLLAPMLGAAMAVHMIHLREAGATGKTSR